MEYVRSVCFSKCLYSCCPCVNDLLCRQINSINCKVIFSLFSQLSKKNVSDRNMCMFKDFPWVFLSLFLCLFPQIVFEASSPQQCSWSAIPTDAVSAPLAQRTVTPPVRWRLGQEEEPAAGRALWHQDPDGAAQPAAGQCQVVWNITEHVTYNTQDVLI